MLEFIVPALQNLLTIENLIWINLGVFIGSVFAAIPGLTVILCIILFSNAMESRNYRRDQKALRGEGV